MPTRLQPVDVVSEDPEIMRLQSIIRGMKHIASKSQLTPDHFRVLAAVELGQKVMGKPPTIEALESLAQMKRKELDPIMRDLIEGKYVHEVMNTYGKLEMRYKLGPQGGTSMRVLLNRSKKYPGEDWSWLNEAGDSVRLVASNDRT